MPLSLITNVHVRAESGSSEGGVGGKWLLVWRVDVHEGCETEHWLIMDDDDRYR